MTEHVSRHHLEELIARSARAGRASTRPELQAEAHVLSCDVCATRRRSIETARAAVLAQLPAEDFARVTLARAAAEERTTSAGNARRAKVLRWSVTGGALAVAAACLLWIQRSQPVAHDDVIRFERSAAGFVYTLSEPRHLLLLSIDDTGAINRYFPVDADSRPLPAGVRVQLQLAVKADAQRGEERLIALFSETPPDENAARRALSVAFQRAGSLSKLGAIDMPAQQATVWLPSSRGVIRRAKN